jgi:small subunit ribosomal protein S21
MNVVVVVRDGDVGQALKRFKKKCEHNGVMRDMKRLAFYTPPGQKRRLDHRRALKRARKVARVLG